MRNSSLCGSGAGRLPRAQRPYRRRARSGPCRPRAHLHRAGVAGGSTPRRGSNKCSKPWDPPSRRVHTSLPRKRLRPYGRLCGRGTMLAGGVQIRRFRQPKLVQQKRLFDLSLTTIWLCNSRMGLYVRDADWTTADRSGAVDNKRNDHRRGAYVLDRRKARAFECLHGERHHWYEVDEE